MPPDSTEIQQTPQQPAKRTDVSQGLQELRLTISAYRVSYGGIYALRLLTTGLFFGLLFMAFKPILTAPEGATDSSKADSSDPAQEVMVVVGKGAGLVLILTLAASTWVMKPTLYYPAIEASELIPNDINELSQALGLEDPQAHSYVSRMLIPLLKRVSSQDADCLSPETLETLCSFLNVKNAYKDFDLISAILMLLTKIGGDEAMPYVRQLATAEFRHNSQERVVVRARHCLHVLHSRHVKEKERSTLLRPASSEASSENLLRPASVSTTPSQWLLRSTAAPFAEIEVKNAAS